MRRPLYAPRAFQHLPGNKFTRVPRYFKTLLLLLSTRSLRFIVTTIYLYVYIYQIRRFFFRFFRNWKLSTKYSLRYGCLDGGREVEKFHGDQRHLASQRWKLRY